MSGDHFAKPGANDRIWGALDKLAVAHPAVFFDYYANDVVALASSAWLGPNYQMTSALNIVNPGGQAQTAHRYYHLGFMPLETAAGYPEHVHRLSPVLTLQGAVAHCDMPVETGPTMYLPHSQKYVPGYLATGLPEFVEYFAQNYVIALGKGRRGILQPRTVPRRRHQSVCRRPADGQSAAGVLGVRAGAGECRPDQGDPCPLPDPAGPEGIRRAGARDRQCDSRFRGGVPVPDQPGPGPADRQSEPGNAGGARPAGAGFPLGGSPLPEHRRSERC